MERNNNTQYNHWAELKNLLKDRYKPQQQPAINEAAEGIQKDYWKRFEDLTGKDRELFRNQLNNINH
jgi:DNA-directed RNA polymerase subunit F